MSRKNKESIALAYHGPRWHAGIYNPFTGRNCTPWWMRILGVLSIVPFLPTFLSAIRPLVAAALQSDLAEQVLTFGMVGIAAALALLSACNPWGRLILAATAITGITAHFFGAWESPFPTELGFDHPLVRDPGTWKASFLGTALAPVLYVIGFAWCLGKSLGVRPLPTYARFGMVFGRPLPMQRQAHGPFGYLAVWEDRLLTDKVVTLRLDPTRRGLRIDHGRPGGSVLGLSEQSHPVHFGWSESGWIRHGRLDSCGRVALIHPFRSVERRHFDGMSWQPVDELPLQDLFEGEEVYYAKRYSPDAPRSCPIGVLLRQRQGSKADVAFVIQRPRGHYVTQYPFEGTSVAVERAKEGHLRVEIEFISGEPPVQFLAGLGQVSVTTHRIERPVEYFLWIPFET